jgi:hypothetical protein
LDGPVACSAKADVYSVGVILYELAHKQLPHTGTSASSFLLAS